MRISRSFKRGLINAAESSADNQPFQLHLVGALCIGQSSCSEAADYLPKEIDSAVKSSAHSHVY